MKFATSILLSLATISVAGHCNIPVFRYALERWRPDECEVIVFHEGDLTAEQETLLAKWTPDARGKHPRANARIIRSDPQEAFLVRWLSAFQPAAFAEGQPLIIAVFGRGRALEVIPASVMSAKLMEDLTVFLSGACSCQVKEQNPGFDLLLSVDWNRELYGEGAEPPAAKPTAAPREPILLSIPPGR